MAVLEGALSGNVAEVTSDKNLNVTLPAVAAQAGYAKILDANGDPILTTENGALNTSLDGVLFFEQVDGTALNTNLWTTSSDTLTITQAGGFITLNGAAVTTGGKYAILNSVKYLPLYAHLPLKASFNVKVATVAQANATVELGIGTATTTSAPTDGAFFRWNSSAELRCVINNGGTELQSAPINQALFAANDIVLCEIVIVEDRVQFFLDDVTVAEVLVATGQAYPTNSGRLPLFARVYTGGSAPVSAPQLNIGQVIVVQQAMNQNKTWVDTMSSLGRGAYQSPITPYQQTANHANSTSPTSATLSNTAASYATFGGRFQFAALAGAVTDYALFAYQVPTGYQLYITSVAISVTNVGAAVSAVTPTVLDWSLGVNSSAVSLATTDSPPTSWAPRRIPLGVQAFVAAALLGQSPNDLVRIFPSTVVCDSGRFVHVILQVPTGAATALEIFRGDVLLNGYFE